MMSRNGSYSDLNMWTPKAPNNSLATGVTPNHVGLLLANNYHEKSLKLLTFLEKRTEARSKSL